MNTDPAIPTAAKSWDKTTLDALGVKFERHQKTMVEFEFPARMAAASRMMPERLQTSGSPSAWLTVVVDTIAGELGRVNHGNTITPEFEFLPNEAVPSLFFFLSPFEQLSTILSRNEPLSPAEPLSPFTTPPTQITVPHSTSSAAPIPDNPQHASPSSASSRSNESGREPTSGLFAMNFIQATYESIQQELKNVQWYRDSGYRIKPE